MILLFLFTFMLVIVYVTYRAIGGDNTLTIKEIYRKLFPGDSINRERIEQVQQSPEEKIRYHDGRSREADSSITESKRLEEINTLNELWGAELASVDEDKPKVAEADKTPESEGSND